MAKLTLTDITGGYLSVAVFNANNTAIETALENTLSRDGTSPNTMSANLDLNSNLVTNIADGINNQDAISLAQLNAASVVASTITATGVTLADADGNYVATTAEGAFDELADDSFTFGGSKQFSGAVTFQQDWTLQSPDDSNYLTVQIGDDGIVDYLDIAGVVGHKFENYIRSDEGFYFPEIAAALADIASFGQFWVDTSGVPRFTGDNGTDHTLHRQGQVLDMNGAELQNASIANFTMPVESGTIASGVCTIDLDDGNVVEVTLTENITSWTINNKPSSGYFEILIKFVQDGTGSRTVAWAGDLATIDWPAGTAPTITTTATTGTDIVSLKNFDASAAAYFGNYSQDYQ